MIIERDSTTGTPPPPLRPLAVDAIELRVSREAVRAALFRGAARRPTLGRYELLRRLGSGGMGVVFLAHDPRLDRPVAVKVLHEGTGGGSDKDRLLHEARSIARLQHPNVVAVYDVDVDRDRVFVAMEYVDGEPLDRWAQAPRPWTEAVALLVQAGRGLAAAHAAGVVHRDFKPANVLLGRDGRARVADFGLAIAGARAALPALAEEAAGAADPAVAETIALAGTLGAAGTPVYMAPESLFAGTADPRSDQYAFCVAGFEILFGRPPFTGTTLAELCRAKLERPPAFPGEGPALPAALREALSRGLARPPNDRFPDMGALLDALERVLATAPAPLPAAASAPEARPAAALAAAVGCERYLADLPLGVASYPSCTTRASMVRLALARRPLGDDVPAAAREALAHPSLQGERMATVRARLILLALFERRFGDADAWREFLRGLFRAQLSASMQVMALPSPTSTWVLQQVARTWNACHQGAPMTAEPLDPGRARVGVAWPPGLYDALVALEVEAYLRASFELSGVRFFEFQPLALTRERLEGTLVWR